jgi:hypothetical protein
MERQSRYKMARDAAFDGHKSIEPSFSRLLCCDFSEHKEWASDVEAVHCRGLNNNQTNIPSTFRVPGLRLVHYLLFLLSSTYHPVANLPPV